MKKTKSAYITHASVVAAMYVVFTYISFMTGLSGNSFIQLRLSEMLCVLPAVASCAVPGLFVGCFAANLLTGANAFDVVFGSLATLIGAVGALIVSKKTDNPVLISIPTVISNTLIVPLLLKYAYGIDTGLLLMIFGVFAGEFVSASLFGSVFYRAFKRIFK